MFTRTPNGSWAPITMPSTLLCKLVGYLLLQTTHFHTHKVGTPISPLVAGGQITTLLLSTRRAILCFREQAGGPNRNLSLPWGSPPQVGLPEDLNILQVQHGDLAIP
jgi:hypothetical protein